MTSHQDSGVLVDAREFRPGRKTGIARFIEGLTDALASSLPETRIVLAGGAERAFPDRLKKRAGIITRRLPSSYVASEKALSRLSSRAGLFVSPYPKLPVFGCHCPCVHTVHDVLDLTHPAYKRRIKAFFDGYRLRSALRQAFLTWYVSSWSLRETERYARFSGRNPRVRHNGLDERFTPGFCNTDEDVLRKYGLKPGYILAVGNGKPHKNLGLLLGITTLSKRQALFVGVSRENQRRLQRSHPEGKALWVDQVRDEEMPAILRGAFCLAQPSTAEGYGYPPLEAMACGVPAVASRIPVLLETTGGQALYADPSSPGEWLEAFQSLEERSLYQRQVEKGLKWTGPILGPGGWQRHISDIEELLNS